jgi:hypothetical protein
VSPTAVKDDGWLDLALGGAAGLLIGLLIGRLAVGNPDPGPTHWQSVAVQFEDQASRCDLDVSSAGQFTFTNCTEDTAP